MRQRTELFTIGNLVLVVSVLTIQFNKLGMIGNFRQLGHDRKRITLGALLAGLPVAVLARRSKITSRLEVAAELPW